MRSERMADAMREMGFEGELLVSTGSPPESASTLGDIAPECFKAWAFCECMVCSGALQCHVLMRARVGVRVGSHPRLAIHMRKKEASRCKVVYCGAVRATVCQALWRRAAIATL